MRTEAALEEPGMWKSCGRGEWAEVMLNMEQVEKPRQIQSVEAMADIS